MNRLLVGICVALWLAVAAWMGTIMYLSSLTGPEVAEMTPFNAWDKLLHFVAFFAGGALLAGALRASTKWPAERIILVAGLAIAIFGGLDEWRQYYTPLRSGADVYDWMADALGGFAGAAAKCAAWWGVRRARRDV